MFSELNFYISQFSESIVVISSIILDNTSYYNKCYYYAIFVQQNTLKHCPVEISYFQIQTENEQKTNVQVDYDKLADFLKRVTPGILGALDETYGSNAFDDYDPDVTEASSAGVELLKKINTSKESSTQVYPFLMKKSDYQMYIVLCTEYFVGENKRFIMEHYWRHISNWS